MLLHTKVHLNWCIMSPHALFEFWELTYLPLSLISDKFGKPSEDHGILFHTKFYLDCVNLLRL